MNIFIGSKISDADRRKELYEGAVFFHGPSANGVKLCQLARKMAGEAFSPLDPRKAQDAMSAERTAEILSVLKPRFIHHPKAKEYIQGMLAELGSQAQVPRI